MAQHFLLSAAARTLSLRAIYAGGEQKAYRRFCALRWPETNGSPRCGRLESYDLKARRRFKCAACSYQFSATSGAIFASHKLSFVDLLGAICLFVNASKGLSAVRLSCDLDVQYKTAFVLMRRRPRRRHARKNQGRRALQPLPLKKQMPEPVFGQIKQARGFRRFLLRGVEKVANEWGLVCLAHNILKLAQGEPASLAALATG